LEAAIETSLKQEVKIRYFPLRAFLPHTRFHCRHSLLFILLSRDNYSFSTKVWNWDDAGRNCAWTQNLKSDDRRLYIPFRVGWLFSFQHIVNDYQHFSGNGNECFLRLHPQRQQVEFLSKKRLVGTSRRPVYFNWSVIK